MERQREHEDEVKDQMPAQELPPEPPPEGVVTTPVPSWPRREEPIILPGQEWGV